MPRTREIKPAFFTDEDLARVSRDHRLLFEALWTLADRDGLLEDRPQYIRINFCPYDEDMPAARVSEMLDTLAGHGFIQRYQAGGKGYIWVRNLKRHQHIHPKEGSSGFPMPPVEPERPREIPVTTGKTDTSPVILPLPSLPSLPSGPSEPSEIPPAAGARDPGAAASDPMPVVGTGTARRMTGQDLVRLFGQVRHQVFPETLPWHTARDSRGDAGSFAALLQPEEIADVEPTMRMALEHIRDGVAGWNREQHAKDPSFAFGAWKSGFHGLREELHGRGPPVRVAPKGKTRGGIDESWVTKNGNEETG